MRVTPAEAKAQYRNLTIASRLCPHIVDDVFQIEHALVEIEISHTATGFFEIGGGAGHNAPENIRY